MKDTQIENICHWLGLIFSATVCNFSYSDAGEVIRTITPPWGVLGLGYSLREETFNKSNYSTNPTQGALGEQRVRKGLADAAAAGGEDHWRDGEADQQHTAVEAKSE